MVADGYNTYHRDQSHRKNINVESQCFTPETNIVCHLQL